jgi:hypothetical protein
MYPPGTVVILSNGDLAIVTRENVNDPKRPHLKLLFNADKQVYKLDSSFNIEDHKNISITKALSASETEHTMLQFLKIHNKK